MMRYLSLGCLMAVALFSGRGSWLVGESHAGEPTRESPYEWNCAYPYTETTCDEVIRAWWDDYEASAEGEEFHPRVMCGRCDPVKVTDINGVVHTIAHRCDNRRGHQVSSADPFAKVTTYSSSDYGAGWKVKDWKMHTCLQHWECLEYCSLERETPECVASVLINVGRWIPEVGESCELTEEAPSDGSGGGYGDGGYGDVGTSESDSSGSGIVEEPKDSDWYPAEPQSYPYGVPLY